MWINVVTAVGSLIAGSLLTLLSQFLSDQRAIKRDAIAYARQEESARRSFQRQDYLELQDEMVKLSDIVVALHQTKGEAPETRRVQIAELSHLNHRIRALTERCPDPMIRKALLGWVESKDHELQAGSGNPYREARRVAGEAYQEIQRLIGRAIRGESDMT